MADMELKLTTPKGLYYLLLGLTVIGEIVVGVIEVAHYYGMLPF